MYELSIAVQAACSAGRLIRTAWFDASVTNSTVCKSSSTDLVTETDKACEAAIVEMIRNAFPHHHFIGEEGHGSHDDLPNEPTWIIDPIDGTTNFVHRKPSCAVLLALVKDQEPHIAVTLEPINQELFFAVRGKGSFILQGKSLDELESIFKEKAEVDWVGHEPFGARRMKVSGTETVSEALLCLDMGYSRKPEDINLFVEQYRQLTVAGNVRGIRTIGSCGLDLAYLADGRTDGCFHWYGPYIWDWAGGSLLVEEAGGFIGNPRQGEKFELTGRTILGAASVELATRIQEHLQVAAEIAKAPGQ